MLTMKRKKKGAFRDAYIKISQKSACEHFIASTFIVLKLLQRSANVLLIEDTANQLKQN